MRLGHKFWCDKEFCKGKRKAEELVEAINKWRRICERKKRFRELCKGSETRKKKKRESGKCKSKE